MGLGSSGILHLVSAARLNVYLFLKIVHIISPVLAYCFDVSVTWFCFHLSHLRIAYILSFLNNLEFGDTLKEKEMVNYFCSVQLSIIKLSIYFAQVYQEETCRFVICEHLKSFFANRPENKKHLNSWLTCLKWPICLGQTLLRSEKAWI